MSLFALDTYILISSLQKKFVIIQQLSISEGFRGALLGRYEKYIENQRLKNTSIVLQISPQQNLSLAQLQPQLV